MLKIKCYVTKFNWYFFVGPISASCFFGTFISLNIKWFHLSYDKNAHIAYDVWILGLQMTCFLILVFDNCHSLQMYILVKRNLSVPYLVFICYEYICSSQREVKIFSEICHTGKQLIPYSLDKEWFHIA